MARYGGFGQEDQGAVEFLYVSASENSVSIPESIKLFDAQFERDGSDLILLDNGTPSARIIDYFSSGVGVDLRAANGAVLRAEIVERLAGSETDGMYAQVGQAVGPTPIGQVELISGNASVLRVDGTEQQLAVGVKIYQQDVLQTGGDGNLSVTFADGTIFTLSPPRA